MKIGLSVFTLVFYIIIIGSLVFLQSSQSFDNTLKILVFKFKELFKAF